MEDLYVLKSLSGAEEYVRLVDSLGNDRIHYMKGEKQFFGDDPVVFGVSEHGGIEIPDLMYHNGIWIVTNKFKNLLDSMSAHYVSYKEAIIQSKQLGIEESCWIFLPPSIDCLDLDESVFEHSWDFSFGLIPMLKAEKIVILPRTLGRYEIFKVFGVLDSNVYVRKGIKDVLTNSNLDGVELLQYINR